MKNTKIMAILVVLLAAALCIGAASAAYTVTTYADQLGNEPNQGFIAGTVGNPIYIKVINDTNPADTQSVEVVIRNGSTDVSTVTGIVGQMIPAVAKTQASTLETQFVNITMINSVATTSANTKNATIEVANSTGSPVTLMIVGVPNKAISQKQGLTAKVILDPVNGTKFGFKATIIGGKVAYNNQALLTTGIDSTTTYVDIATKEGNNMTSGELSTEYPVRETAYIATLKLLQANAPGYVYTILSTDGGINCNIPTEAIVGDVYTVTIVVDADATFAGQTATIDFGNGAQETVTLAAGQTITKTTTYNAVDDYLVEITSQGITLASETVYAEIGDRAVYAQNHDSAFVYETVRVMNTTTTGDKVDKLYFYSSDSTPTLLATMSATDTIGTFELLEAAVNGHYGAWYVKPDTKSNYITIWYPEISLKAELTTGANGATSGDSIDGKTINKNTEVSFLIEAPNVGPAKIPAVVKIVFTTPASGKTTVFGYDTFNDAVDFKDISLTTVQTIANGTGVTAGNDATAGTWTAQAEFTSPKGFKDNAKKTNTISFTLQSTTLTITAAKDSVVRSNPFTVSIQGDSKTDYAVYLESISTSDVNPALQSGQVGFQTNDIYDGTPAAGYLISGGIISYDGYPDIGGIFQTDASGKRNIQYNTADNTEDKTYTVKVSGLKVNDKTLEYEFDSSNYDKVKVKVEKGAVTIAATGDGSYYIGDEIKLTGTNTDSTNVFLFITGQNLAQNGILVKSLPDKISAKENSQPVSVKTDNTWEYKWDTSKIALDTGAYTIYATSRLTNGKSSEAGLVATQEVIDKGYAVLGTDGNWYAVKLSDSEYATVSINLKQPFLSAVPSGTIVAKGDKIYVRGTAEGDPSNLNLFIFGPNFFEPYSITVEDDGSYEKKIEISSTMSSNQYFVVVQHPMYNDRFDAHLAALDNNGNEITATWPDDTVYQWAFKTVNTTTGGDAQSFIVWGSSNKLQGSQAADALTKMIDSANIDDIYTKLTFTVAEPWIKITNPGDKAVGSKFTITGTTNLAVDDQILVEVMSSSFSAVDKTSTSTTAGVSQATKVVAGEGTDNTWSVDVDTTNWKLDEYTIKVNGIEVDVTTTTNFNLVEKVVTTAPTTSATTAVPTGATSVPTTTPTKTPGFGAFIALAGLGAVALLVLRRN